MVTTAVLASSVLAAADHVIEPAVITDKFYCKVELRIRGG